MAGAILGALLSVCFDRAYGLIKKTPEMVSLENAEAQRAELERLTSQLHAATTRTEFSQQQLKSAQLQFDNKIDSMQAALEEAYVAEQAARREALEAREAARRHIKVAEDRHIAERIVRTNELVAKAKDSQWVARFAAEADTSKPPNPALLSTLIANFEELSLLPFSPTNGIIAVLRDAGIECPVDEMLNFNALNARVADLKAEGDPTKWKDVFKMLGHLDELFFALQLDLDYAVDNEFAKRIEKLDTPADQETK